MTDKLATLPPMGETALQVGDLLRHAIDKGVSVESLERLVALHERIADRMAAQEFAVAMSDFQRRCPPIRKNKKASIRMDSGASFSYQYAELHEIASVVNPLLAELGLSYTWDSKSTETSCECTCTVRHVNGHSVTASFSAPIQARSKATSQAQNGAMALTHAKRQALVQVLGLTLCDPDTDAAVEPSGAITATQAADLECLIEEVKADRGKFLKYMETETVEEIPASEYDRAVAALRRKKK